MRSQTLPAAGARISADGVSRFVARTQWNLERFGVSPQKITRRLLNRTEPRILLVSLPKSGTHLLERALARHPRLYRRLGAVVTGSTVSAPGAFEALLRRIRPGEFVAAHLDFDPRYPSLAAAAGVRVVFQIRDPRDVVVSHAHYVSSNPKHWLHDVYRRQHGFRDRLKISIVGHADSGFPSIGQRLQDSSGWLEAADVVVRFESLVGVAGGGDDTVQRDTVRSLYARLGVQADELLVSEVAADLFSRVSPTFRRGAIGQWKEHFDDELKALFRDAVLDGLDRYGYEHGDR